jgi:hypothetical protein
MMRRSLFAVAAAGLVLAFVAPAQIAAAGVTTAAKAERATTSFPTMHGFKMPYSDPNQAGLLTLCNEKLQPITHGSISTVPFVWRAVASVAAPSYMRIKGATATLVAYQPRPYTPAGAWSGTDLSAGAVYSNPGHPMAQLTPVDFPLSQMTGMFPPIWDHLIELRLYLGAPNRSPDVMGYAAADIQVIGNTWTMVEGGDASCTDGTAVSREVQLGIPGASRTAAPGATTGAEPAAKTGSASPAAAGAASSASTGSGATAADSDSAASSSSGSSIDPVAIILGVLAVVLLAGGGLVRSRRRSRAGL